jgi:diphosphomevalonate decarboxylase
MSVHAAMNGRAVATANTNIALVKYWGKRDARLNLPAVGSLSLTLDGLSTRTTVSFDAALAGDALTLNGAPADEGARKRVAQFLDLVRALAGKSERAHVESANNFPTAAGLASSASAFAALALAATRAAGLTLEPRELSILARRGSGSAARSLFGGLVQMHRGARDDGDDAFAEPIDDASWGVRLVIAATSDGPKQTLSTDGMRHTAETSPYFPAWVATSEADLLTARQAIGARDLAALGEVTERSCLTMHASAMAARPAVVYFQGATLDGYHAIQALRRAGTPAWFTCDAGPHVKALTDAAHAEAVEMALARLPGVKRTWLCRPGDAARVIE